MENIDPLDFEEEFSEKESIYIRWDKINFYAPIKTK